MSKSKFNPTIIEEGLGAAAIAASLVTSPLIRSWYSKWGATAAEVEMTLPGDEFVPNPVLMEISESWETGKVYLSFERYLTS